MTDVRSRGAGSARVGSHHVDVNRPPRGQAALITTAVVVAALALGWLARPPGGTDLSAQLARADFARQFGLTPVDFRWYGGTNQFGYSVISPFVMAALGVRVTGALAAIASALLFTLILVRTRVRRPVLGGIAGAGCIVANLVSGRITYALGLVFALAAVAAATDPNPRRRTASIIVATVLAALTSPVAGLFTGLAGAALILAGHRRDGLVMGIAALVPILVTAALFGQGGWMNISQSDVVHSTALCGVALIVVPHRVIRAGALLAALGIVAAFTVRTPVGLNAIRLPVMLAIPVVVATLRWRLPLVVTLAALMGWWQAPIMLGDLHDAGTPLASQAYFAPLTTELARLRPTGRVEVPPTRDYWESAYVARTTPLARGWMRQLDLRNNLLFFNGTLTARSYRGWLSDNAVQYVAVPDARLAGPGSDEGRLLGTGLPYLHRIWTSQHWTVYAVVDSAPVITAPARLVSMDAIGVTIAADRPLRAGLRVRYSRWLTIDGPGACLARQGSWSRLTITEPGTYRISSALHSTHRGHCGD